MEKEIRLNKWGGMGGVRWGFGRGFGGELISRKDLGFCAGC